MSPSQKMASTLRLFTRGGREETFSTTLVEDLYSRHLRALVAAGFLTMDYTGTRRVYALTSAGREYLQGKRMSKKKQAEPKPPAAEKPAEKPPEPPPRKERAPKRPRPAEDASAPDPKKKSRAPAAKRAPAPPPTPPPPKARSAAALSPLDVIRLMREVRDYADAHEGVEGLLALIQRVEQLGQRFGGLDCVRESLEAIREFRGDSSAKA